MSTSGGAITDIAIGVAIIVLGTAIYILHHLFKEKRRRKDLESSGEIPKEPELELEPLPEEMKEVTQIILHPLETNTPKDLQSSNTISLSKEKERKSSSNINSRSSKSFNIKGSRPRSSQLSRNGSRNDSRSSSRNDSRSSSRNDSRNSSRNDSRNGSWNDSRNGSRNDSRNGSRNDSRNGSRNGSRYGSRSSRYSTRYGSIYSGSLIITKPQKKIPPPPPPSPLKSRNTIFEIDLDPSLLNIIPSDISESTYTPPLSSTASSQVLSSKSDLKAHSLIPSQPTSPGYHSELD